MKKLTLSIAIIASSLMSFAQNDNKPNNNTIIPPSPIEQSNFSLGIKGGFGHSFLVPYQNYAFNPSWNAGLSVVYAPWVHWGLGLDAVYSREGATFTSGETDYTTTLDYVRIPVKGIYYFKKYEHDFRPKVSLGPTLGFLVNEENTNSASSFDFGANVSAGFNYRLVRAVWLNVDATYYQGFLDTYKANADKDLNGNVRLDIGLSFGF